MKYKVELDVYCGPLELLLQLLKRDELEIQRIPVSRVADQFVSYLENIAEIDIEIAGDFLVMAARLTEMKSRSLLPTITTEDEDIDPDLLADETDLIQRLLEYRVFKDISRKLRRNSEIRAFRFGRAMFPEFVEEPQEEGDILEGVTIMDIFSAFHRIAREVQLEESRTIFYDDVPIERHIERVLEKLTSAGAFAFSHIIPKGVRKAYIIGAFIALLELVKQKKISLAQEEDFKEITIDQHVMPPPLPEEDEGAAGPEQDGQAQPADGHGGAPPENAGPDLTGGIAPPQPDEGLAIEPAEIAHVDGKSPAEPIPVSEAASVAEPGPGPGTGTETAPEWFEDAGRSIEPEAADEKEPAQGSDAPLDQGQPQAIEDVSVRINDAAVIAEPEDEQDLGQPNGTLDAPAPGPGPESGPGSAPENGPAPGPPPVGEAGAVDREAENAARTEPQPGGEGTGGEGGFSAPGA